MSLPAAALRKMLDLGLTLEQAVELAEVWEAGAARAIPEISAAALRQRRYRARKGGERDGDVTRDVTGDVTTVTLPPLPLAPPPQTPPPHTPTPPGITTRAKPNGFARFWEAYPNKVGKRDAEKAYANALRRMPGHDPPSEILAGIDRARASRKWREGIIPNPATWLNQDRWEDQPVEPQTPQGRPHERPHPDAKHAARQANLATFERGADLAARLHRES